MRKLTMLLIAISLLAFMPVAFAGGSNTSVTAVVGTGNNLTIDISIADPDGIARVTISSDSDAGEKIRVTDTPAPTCSTSVTYGIDPRDSTAESYDVGVLDCGDQASITHVNADGSVEPTEYNTGPVVGAPALSANKLELLLPFIGLASIIVAGTATIVYLTRSKSHETNN